MLLIEYINSPLTLDPANILNLERYNKLIHHFTSNYPDKCIYFDYSQDYLENNSAADYFSKLSNKVVFVSNVDIDFPPPKKPYKYDKYADFSKFPPNYLDIHYADKVETELKDIIEKNNLIVITNSVSVYSKNIVMIPIGPFKSFRHFRLKANLKTNLCYANFGVPIDRWFGNPRKKIVDFIKAKPFIKYSDTLYKKVRVGYKYMNVVDNDAFYNDISRSKFTICPRGCGIDTYRLWDCICLGSIPIVDKYEGHESFRGLPILFLENEDKYADLTEEFLNNTYEKFLKQDFSFEMMSMFYWHNKTLDAIKNSCPPQIHLATE